MLSVVNKAQLRRHWRAVVSHMQLLFPLQVCGVEYLMPQDVAQATRPETLVNMQRLSAMHKPDPPEVSIDSQAAMHFPATHEQSVLPLHWSMD